MAETTYSTLYSYCEDPNCDWHQQIRGVAGGRGCPKCQHKTIKQVRFHGQMENSLVTRELHKGATFRQVIEMVNALPKH